MVTCVFCGRQADGVLDRAHEWQPGLPPECVRTGEPAANLYCEAVGQSLFNAIESWRRRQKQWREERREHRHEPMPPTLQGSGYKPRWAGSSTP